MNDILWSPSPERIANSRMTAFRQWLETQYDIELSDYTALHEWSIKNREEFWSALWGYFDVQAFTQYNSVLKNGERMPGAQWFEGATLNFAQHLLRYRGDTPAIVSWLENGSRRELSHEQLYRSVADLALWLKAQGVVEGDRVVGFMPNIAESVVAMLAATSLGAIWSSCSPDFGFQGVMDRFGQIDPKVLICADGYFYNGKTLDCLERVAELQASLPSLQKIIVVPLINSSPEIASLPQAALYTDIVKGERNDIGFVPVRFDHPLYIMYSSGTTGVPKCIVHGTGGTLLQHMKELALHADLKAGDVIFYYTTCGWMMWNWLVSSLSLGATVVLYDGSPFAPRPEILWDIAEREGVTHFGTSAKYIAALEKAGVKPRETHDLGKLRCLMSTGSPLAHEGFDYVYRDIKTDLCLSSISGGTDIISCFALGNPNLPVYRGELQCKGLGMAVDIFNDEGTSVTNEKGELVCTKAFPSMPVAFWKDETGEKYFNAYFSRFPNIWAHGDYGEQNNHDGVIIYGRSDAVLNPGGVRIGTAEIYRQVEKIPEVLESIAIGQDWEGDVRVVLFVRLREGLQLDETLAQKIRRVIRDNTTPRHVPAKILQVKDIPRTISGKIVELAVRNVVHGLPVKNTDALANPEALEYFRGRKELES